MTLHLRTAAPAPSAAQDTPWYPKPCPFCGEQEFIAVELFYSDTFRPRTAYAVCRNGHRSAAFQWQADNIASLYAAKEAARNDWDTRK